MLVLSESGFEIRKYGATFLPFLLQEVNAKLFLLQREPHPFGVKALVTLHQCLEEQAKNSRERTMKGTYTDNLKIKLQKRYLLVYSSFPRLLNKAHLGSRCNKTDTSCIKMNHSIMVFWYHFIVPHKKKKWRYLNIPTLWDNRQFSKQA